MGTELLRSGTILLNLRLQITKHPGGFLGFNSELFQACLGALFLPGFYND